MMRLEVIEESQLTCVTLMKIITVCVCMCVGMRGGELGSLKRANWGVMCVGHKNSKITIRVGKGEVVVAIVLQDGGDGGTNNAGWKKPAISEPPARTSTLCGGGSGGGAYRSTRILPPSCNTE